MVSGINIVERNDLAAILMTTAFTWGIMISGIIHTSFAFPPSSPVLAWKSEATALLMLREV